MVMRRPKTDIGSGLLGALAVGHGHTQLYRRRAKESEVRHAEAQAQATYTPKLTPLAGWQKLRKNRVNASKLVEVLRHGIGMAMDNGLAYRDFFRRLDSDGSGEIEGRELQKGLRWLGIELNDREVQVVLRRFSADGASLRYEDFLRFCEGEAREMDELFEGVRSAVKKLGGSEELSVALVHDTLDIEVGDHGCSTLDAVCVRLRELGLHVSDERREVLRKQFRVRVFDVELFSVAKFEEQLATGCTAARTGKPAYLDKCKELRIAPSRFVVRRLGGAGNG